MLESRQTPPAGDLTRLRQINERAVLELVRTAENLRVAEIATATGLTRVSVVEVLKSLEEKGWVTVEAPVVAGRGRPAQRYRFRAEAGRVVGVDIGAHSVRAVIANLAGTVVATAERAVTPELTRRRRLNAVVGVVTECMSSAGFGPEDIWVSVIGSTGRVDATGRVLLASAIPDWAGLDLPGALSGRVPGGQVLVENDIRLVTIAEQRLGVARDAEDLILVQAGRRTGFGIVLDGRLRRGHGGVAGDLSPFNALSCDDAFSHIDDCTAVPSTGATDDHSADVLAAAAEGNKTAVTSVRRYTRAIAQVTATAVSLLDPELVVLGGILARCPELVLPVFENELESRCMRTPRIKASLFGQDAVALGAVCHGLAHIGDLLLDTDGAVPPFKAPVGA
jgi:predicted NBD/HSP70 family sugar kinase